MLANSTSYSHSHSHPYLHSHSVQAAPLAYLDNMSGWSREYAHSAPREAASTSASKSGFKHHHSSSSSNHEIDSNGHPSGMTMSHSSPTLPFSTWDQNQRNLTSSTSSPSLLFDHGGIEGHADQSNNHSFGYNGTGSTTTSANYRHGYPCSSNVKVYASHAMPLTSSASYPSLPATQQQSATAMYNQQHTTAIPTYHHSSFTGGASNPAANLASSDVGDASLPEPRGLAATLLGSPNHPTHHHHQHQQQQHHPEDVYASSTPVVSNSSHSLNPQQHNLPNSPGLNDFNSEYRSSHMLHPFEVKHRRRTTRTQFKVLEATFRENPKPNASVRKSVSQQLDMPIRAVQIWFQNRRAKAKAAAKKEEAGHQMEDVDQDNEDLDHYQSQYLENEDGQRYSSSPTSSLRRTTDSNSIGYHSTPVSASSETFKIPNRPLRIDTEASNRRMTTGAMSSSATFAGNTFYHSPPLSSSGSLGPYSSHLSNSSPSFDTRPTSSSISSSASYDDRYRRGAFTSPGVLQHDNGVAMGYPGMTPPHRQSQQAPPFHPHQQYQHQPPQAYHHHQQHHHHHPSQEIDMHLPSAFDPETRRLSLPENIPADVQLSGNLSILQQHQQQQHLQLPQQQQQLQHSNPPTTEYWRY